MSVCARLAGSSSHQWGWLRRELAELDADARARAEADSSAVRSEFNAARAKFNPDLDIQLIDSASLPEHLRQLVEKRPAAEGLWNNGSIYLLEDRISPGRVRKVLLHEVVAHEGLRRVFGKDYDSFLRQIVNQYADPISSLAARRHIDITTPAGQLEAADEFLAELAESRLAPDSPVSAPAASDSSRAPQGAALPSVSASAAQQPLHGGSALSSGSAATLAEPNGRHLQGGSAADTFERPWGATLRSALRSVLASLRAFLRRHGWNLAWTDNDLSALLARSARSVSAQSAPNPSAASNPSDPRFSDDLDVAQAFPEPLPSKITRSDIVKRLENIQKKNLINRDSGKVAQINKNQRGKLTSDAALSKSENNGFSKAEHFQAVANIEALYENAILIYVGPDTKNGDPLVTIHRFAAPVVLNGKIADALMTAKESADKENGIKVYSLELDEIVAAIEGERLKRGASRLQRAHGNDRTHADYLPEGIHKLQQKHEKVKRALEIFNGNSTVAPAPRVSASAAQSASDKSNPSDKSDSSNPRFSDDLDVSQAFPAPIAQNATREDIESKLESLDKKALTNRDTGTVAQINGNQRRKIVSDAAVRKSKNNGFSEAEHFQAAANIEALYENAVLLHSGPDTKNHDPFLMIHRFGAPVVLDGKIADAILVLKESVNKENCTRLYALELEGIVQKIEDGSGVRPGFRTPWDNITHEYFPEGIHKLQQKHEKVKRALEIFNGNSTVAPAPRVSASAAAQNPRAPQGAALPGVSASAAAQHPRAPQGAAPGAETPLSGPARAQSPTPRSGSTAAPGGSALSSGNAATLARRQRRRHFRASNGRDTSAKRPRPLCG